MNIVQQVIFYSKSKRYFRRDRKLFVDAKQRESDMDCQTNTKRTMTRHAATKHNRVMTQKDNTGWEGQGKGKRLHSELRYNTSDAA